MNSMEKTQAQWQEIANQHNGLPELIVGALPSFAPRLQVLAAAHSLLIADARTHDACGKSLLELAPSFHTMLLQDPVQATRNVAEQICTKAQALHCKTLIAVGSGTISDVVKFAAHQLNLPYVMIPTAASMNGYASITASLLSHGHKTSFPAQLPREIWLLESVLCAAPARLSRAGLGDVLCTASAHADWLLSHLLADSPYDSTPFDWFDLSAQADGWELMPSLLFSGLAMTLANSSAPASGAEHMMAHLLEAHRPVNALHGELVASCLLHCLKHQEKCVNAENIALRQSAFPVREMSDFVGADAAQKMQQEYQKKHALLSATKARLNDWPMIAARLHSLMIPSTKIETIMRENQLPLSPQMLGYTNEEVAFAQAQVAFTRNRVTFADLVF